MPGFLSAAAVLLAASQLVVTYSDPAAFTDAGYDRMTPGEKDRTVVMQDLTAHLQALAKQHLPSGTSLKIEVLDIDLAGDFPPFAVRGGTDLRVVRDVTWPRLRLRWTLTAADGRVTSDEETVSDLNFLQTVNRYFSSDRLRYEKQMLDTWFTGRFGAR